MKPGSKIIKMFSPRFRNRNKSTVKTEPSYFDQWSDEEYEALVDKLHLTEKEVMRCAVAVTYYVNNVLRVADSNPDCPVAERAEWRNIDEKLFQATKPALDKAFKCLTKDDES